MTAGTVVITGGILASVILLCIIGVLCYCRLQYYCCKKDELHGEEEDHGHQPHSHFPCHDCSSTHLDAAFPPYVAPAYSPYGSPYIIRTADTMCNGRERDSFTPTHYAEAGPLLIMGTPNLSRGLQALSTQV